MKFLFDHDVPDELSYLLKQLGHEVRFLREVLPRTATDSQILEYARANGYLVITCNRDDFLNLAKQQLHHGVIVVLRRKSRTAEKAALLRLVENAGPAGLANNINFA